MGDINKLVERMRYWCDEANLGYDQWQRWDIRVGGECDCSSLVIFCLREAGFETGGVTYTGNMRANLTARGFKVVTPNGHPLPGDILLNDENHVAVCTGNGILSQASRGEAGSRVHGGRAGDQDGYETNTRAYYDYPWDCYLRYAGNTKAQTQATTAGKGLDELAQMVIEGKFGTGQARRDLLGDKYDAVQGRVNQILAAGTEASCNGGMVKVDGDVGPQTVFAWQTQMGTEPDGVITGQSMHDRPYVRNVSSMRFSARCEGSQLVRAIQRKVGAEVDGLWGCETSARLQHWLNSKKSYQLDVDGLCGPQTAMAIQTSINAGVWA